MFDRIRENLRKFKRLPLLDLMNLSINETLSRTVLTATTTFLAVLALFVFGTLAASAQGRLGSPDLAQLATVLGPGGLGPILWARALLGPILSIALTIVVSHRWLRPRDIVAPWETFALFLVVGAFVLATYPLEKRPS